MADAKPEQFKAAPKKLYRFTYPYACYYEAPLSRHAEFGEEIEWPDGPPDPNWEPVQVDEKPQPAPVSAGLALPKE